jgi:hypothetical protein
MAGFVRLRQEALINRRCEWVHASENARIANANSHPDCSQFVAGPAYRGKLRGIRLIRTMPWQKHRSPAAMPDPTSASVVANESD